MSKPIKIILPHLEFLQKLYGIPVLLFLTLLFTDVSAKRKDEMRWDRAEKEVGTRNYSKEMKDSIFNVYNIKSYKGLRNLSDHTLPFSKSEKLVYDGGWGFLRAGFGIFNATIDKDNARININGKAFSNNFVSAFYKIRDYASTIIDLTGLYPYFFEQHIEENRYKKSSWTIYDHKNGKVYSNARKKTKFDISPFSNNYISLLYYLRTINFAPGDTFSIPCFVHGKNQSIFFKVSGPEQVKVDAGTFKCLKVEPRLVGEGRGFTKRDKMYLWFTDDKRHLLVKGKSKIAIGWISAELLYFKCE